ncbi:DUF4203 domain-containing protein [Candidatus Saccharibacteria bacterium]|nr:DUF4203 domain-containing protein [Candidatus Saccharibacteria bacterium]
MNIVNLSELNDIEVIAMLIAGVLLLFAGYKIKKIGFFIVWFILGVSLMGYLMPTINHAVPEIAQNNLWQSLLPIAGGLLLGLMGFSVEKICVGGIAFGLTLAITAQYFGTNMQTMLIGGVVGVILAGVSVFLMKPAIIVATSLAGSYAVTMSILHWGVGIDPTTFYFPMLFGGTGLGSVVQFLTTRRE